MYHKIRDVRGDFPGTGPWNPPFWQADIGNCSRDNRNNSACFDRGSCWELPFCRRIPGRGGGFLFY